MGTARTVKVEDKHALAPVNWRISPRPDKSLSAMAQ